MSSLRAEPDDALVWRCICGSHLNYDGAPLLRPRRYPS